MNKDEIIIQKYLKMQERCRIRQKKYYDKHKETISKDRKIKRSKSNVMCDCKEVLDLDNILQKLDNCDKITNENTRQCHKNRITTFFEITKINDMTTDLLNYKEIIDRIENSTYGRNHIQYKSNSKKNMLESFLFCLDKLDIILDKDIRQEYQDFYLKAKLRCNDELEIKKTNQDDAVISYNEYEKKVLDKFGLESKEFLMIKMYKEAIVRDDFDLFIINDEEKHKDDVTKNYLIEDNKKYTILLQCYKTSKNKKNPIKIKLSSELDNLIYQYITKNKIEHRLFPSKHGLNSSYISKMHKKLDINGSINTIRHIIISSGLIDMNLEERVQMAKNSFHSVNTQRDYKRKQKNE